MQPERRNVRIDVRRAKTQTRAQRNAQKHWRDVKRGAKVSPAGAAALPELCLSIAVPPLASLDRIPIRESRQAGPAMVRLNLVRWSPDKRAINYRLDSACLP